MRAWQWTGPLLATADDTTGALESAAMVADRGWTATVAPWTSAPVAPRDPAGCLVVDLRSRHQSAGVAAARLADALNRFPTVRVHKIDSTLRGNWPAEIAAAVAAGRRVLMVPAYPAAGRVCSGGVVTEHGVPVDRTAHASDPRAPVLNSRPSTLLPASVELASLVDVDRWLHGVAPVGIADVIDDGALHAVVELASAHEVLLVGPAAVVASVGRRAADVGERHVGRSSHVEVSRPRVGPVVVVCGSLHPASRVQVERLVHRGASVDAAVAGAQVVVVATPVERHDDSVGAANALAARAHRLVRSMGAGTVVLLGGDTAEAFIGDRSVSVFGSLDVGVAVGSIGIDGRSVTLLTKPGGFGRPNTLVDLMNDLLNGSGPA